MINPKTYEVFGEAILKKGTQEAAFVHAITAAGVAYQLTTSVIFTILLATAKIF